MDSTLFLQEDCPQDVLTIRPNAQCPVCKMSMIVAAHYDRDGKSDSKQSDAKETVEGKASIRHICHGCGKTITPVSI